MALETVEKGSTGIISGVEKMLGKGKTVTKDVSKAVTSDKAKAAGKTALKVTGKTAKVAGKAAVGVAGVGGSLLSSGAKGVSSLLGSSGGLSSLLKTGSILGVLALLTNKKAMVGITSLMSGATGALSNTATNISKGSTATTSLNTSSAVNQQVASQESVANSSTATIGKTNATTNSSTLTSTGSLAKDKYAQAATKNLSMVVSNNQPTAQTQQTVQSQTDQLNR